MYDLKFVNNLNKQTFQENIQNLSFKKGNLEIYRIQTKIILQGCFLFLRFYQQYCIYNFIKHPYLIMNRVKKSKTKEIDLDPRYINLIEKSIKQISKNQVKQRYGRPSFPSVFQKRNSHHDSMINNSRLGAKSIQLSLPKLKNNIYQNSSFVNNNVQSLSQQKIQLKPVPMGRSLGTKNFGWKIANDKQQRKQYLNINKAGKVYSVVSDKNHNQWLQILRSFKNELRQINERMSTYSPDFWNHFISKFQKYHLNNDQKIQFLQLISKFFEGNFGQLKVSNQFQFFGQMGRKCQQLENRIHFKHKYSLQNIKFFVDNSFHKERFYNVHFPQLEFNMEEYEILDIAAIVRGFCQNNMDAFALLTLYFRIALKNQFQKNQFRKIEEKYIKSIDKLAEIYKANDQATQQNLQSYGLQSFPFNQKFEIIKFKNNNTSRYEQLQQYILQKAIQAKQDQIYFRELVEDQCYKYGYSFKSGLKIKSDQSYSSIFRTIQKLMQKKKYEENFVQYKKQLTSRNFNIDKFTQENIKYEIKQAEKLIEQLLAKQSTFQVDAKDLLRGKCKFNKIEQIIETVQNLKIHIQSEGHKILQLKNRLNKNTKDVTIVIKLPHSIAQLQLVLKLDSVSNEFNHKLYQLQRSHIHTPITNLFIHNERWCETFFTEQLQLFEQLINMARQPDLKQNITFKRLTKDVLSLKRKYLQPNQIKYEKNFAIKREEKFKLLQKIKQIKGLINEIKQNSGVQQFVLTTEQKLNQINFFKHFDYEKALQIMQYVDQHQLQSNLMLLNLKGDILQQHGSYDQSLKCYQKYINLHKQSHEEDIDLANVLHNIGWIYDIMQQPQKAIEFYQKSLYIKQKIKGEKSLDVATTLNGIGWVYSNLKIKDDYPKALDYYQKSLQIRQNLLGKQNIDVATSLSNIGVVYRRQGDFIKALQYQKRSLQIRQKLLGKQSIDAASSLHNIGVAYHYKKDHQKALQNLNRSAQIRQKILGKDSFDLASSYHYLSFVYEALQNLENASKAIKVANTIFKKVLGQQHHKTKLSYEQYVDIQKKLEKNSKLDFLTPFLARLTTKRSYY